MSDTCRNCGGWEGLHHYGTNQCPRNGMEAPVGRKQEWLTTTFERDDSSELAYLRARVAELEAAVSEAHVAMVKIGNDLNWEAPADEQLADAINACRACGIAHPAPEEVTQ
jgi:hypothetical protein